MDIQFVNHASYVLRSDAISLLVDPWSQGEVFNEGWALLCPTPIAPCDIADVTHIWFSHEHPDHFSVSDLQAFPEDRRAQIKVLFQRTEDQRVIGYCRKLGFQTEELPLNEWYNLQDMKLYCGSDPNPYADSWLLARSGDQSVLNLNDCDLLDANSCDHIASLGPFNLLCTQFSYAAWQGNEADSVRRQAEAKTHLDGVLYQTKRLQPDYVMPFASHIWFCHEENGYLNQDVNRIDQICDALLLQAESQPLILYPGDRWTLGNADHSNTGALAKFADQYQTIGTPQRPALRAAPIERQELLAAAQVFVQRYYRLQAPSSFVFLALESFRNRSLGGTSMISNLRQLAVLSRESAKVYVTDHECSYELSTQGLVDAEFAQADCDLSLGSQSLLHCFRVAWGAEALRINGRFREPADVPEGLAWRFHPNRFFNYFLLPRRISLGQASSFGALAKQLINKILGRVGLR